MRMQTARGVTAARHARAAAPRDGDGASRNRRRCREGLPARTPHRNVRRGCIRRLCAPLTPRRVGAAPPPQPTTKEVEAVKEEMVEKAVSKILSTVGSERAAATAAAPAPAALR